MWKASTASILACDNCCEVRAVVDVQCCEDTPDVVRYSSKAQTVDLKGMLGAGQMNEFDDEGVGVGELFEGNMENDALLLFGDSLNKYK